MLGSSIDALPRVIPSIANADSAQLKSKPAVRRDHPVLKALRGRCFDHFPPIYYPPGTDLTQPGSKASLFFVPEIGYVSSLVLHYWMHTLITVHYVLVLSGLSIRFSLPL